MSNVQNQAVLTASGPDRPGIMACLTQVLAEHQVNIIDINQSIFQGDLFNMIMLIDLEKADLDLPSLESALKGLAEKLNLNLILRHAEVFRAMHRI